MRNKYIKRGALYTKDNLPESIFIITRSEEVTPVEIIKDSGVNLSTFFAHGDWRDMDFITRDL